MRFLRSPIHFLVLISSAALAYGQSDNRFGEPQLGAIILLAVDTSDPDARLLLPGEPKLGPIIPIAAFYEPDSDDVLPPAPPHEFDDVRSHRVYGVAPLPMIASAAARVISQPMAAPIGEPFAFEIPPIPGPVHPDEIHAHLSAAAAQLASAGLATEAQKIQQFQEQLDRDHSQQLLIAFKQAQIRELQAEIEFLKRTQQPVAKNIPVMLKMKFIELDVVARGALLSKLNGGQNFCAETAIGTVVGSCDPQWIGEFVESLCKNGDANIVAEPACAVPSGMTVSVSPTADGQRLNIITTGIPLASDASCVLYKTEICASAQLLDRRFIQLKVSGHYKHRSDSTDESTGIAVVTNLIQRSQENASSQVFEPIEANVKLTTGESMVFVGRDHGKTLLLLVTPEILPNSQMIPSALPNFSFTVQGFEPRTTSFQSAR